MKRKGKYLLRLDDFSFDCNWKYWDDILSFLIELGIKPIIAVIPDNKDKEDSNNPIPILEFWNKVRYYQSKGCTIALHGENHLKVNDRKGIMRVTNASEFVGLSYDVQYKKISNGINIFRNNGVKTNMWIAPFHSFDYTTLKVLKKVGINVISDSYSTFPYYYKGFYWVGCQLWDRFRKNRKGIWTICYHPNVWDDNKLNLIKDDILKNIDNIVGFEDINNIKVSSFRAITTHKIVIIKYQFKSFLKKIYKILF